MAWPISSPRSGPRCAAVSCTCRICPKWRPATLARRAALRLAGQALSLRPLPPEVDPGPFGIDMVSSRRAPADAALAWLQGLIERAVKDLTD